MAMSRTARWRRAYLSRQGSGSVQVPNETPIGDGAFKMLRTSDNTTYVRETQTGTIRHIVAKKRGKAARRADKLARRAKPRSATTVIYDDPSAVVGLDHPKHIIGIDMGLGQDRTVYRCDCGFVCSSVDELAYHTEHAHNKPGGVFHGF